MRHVESRLTLVLPSLLAACLILAGCPSGESGPRPPRLDETISPDPEALVAPSALFSRPTVCGEGDDVYLLWTDVRNEHRIPKITFTHSGDGGRTWEESRPIGEDAPDLAYQHHYPKIACGDGGLLHVVWWSKAYGGAGEGERVGDKYIRHRASSDGGSSWGEIHTLNASPDAFDPSLALGGDGHVYVAWSDERVLGVHVPFFTSSADGGETWPDTDLRLDILGAGQQEGQSGQPGLEEDRVVEATEVRAVALPGGKVFVSWSGFPGGTAIPWYTASRDGGQTWSPAPPDHLVPYESQHILLPVVTETGMGDGVVVAWLGTEDYDVSHYGMHVSFSPDWGETWPVQDEVLTEGLVGFDDIKSHYLASDGAGRVYLVWDDRRNRLKPDIWLSRSGDGGRSWSDPLRIDGGHDPGTVTAEIPYVAAAADGRVLVLWMDRRRQGRSAVYGRLSPDGGDRWTPAFHIGGGFDRASDATFPSAAFIDEDRAVVVWQEGFQGPQALRTRTLRTGSGELGER